MQKLVRIIGLILIDVLLINLSYILAFLLRFDFVTDTTAFATAFENYISFWLILTVIKVIIFFMFGLYTSLWRFAGAHEMAKVIGATVVANAAVTLVLMILVDGGVQRSLVLLPWVFDLLLAGGVRMLYRFAVVVGSRRALMQSTAKPRRVMLVGSGYNMAAIIKEMRVHSGEIKAVPVVAIDNNRNRLGNRISGVKIAGLRKDIPRLVRSYKVDDIYIVVPLGNKKEIQAIMTECSKTSCKVKHLPSMHELISGRVGVSEMNNIDVEDLLERESVEINLREVGSFLKGRIVLVTGAGGHLGSEICKEVAKFLPRKVIALDISESGVFELRLELKKLCPEVDVQIEICSVTDGNAVREVFDRHKPHIVFHAALHNNAQLMEDSPKEAIKNNVFGTLALINACDTFAADKFIMLSSDKATRPVGVAGASLRLAEMLTQDKSSQSKTQYTVVRLGSILGSDGALVPIFKKQIEQGGPVTITHRDAVRHFMSLEPAIQLILQSGAIAQGGEVFTFKLGRTVRIIELVENLIKMYGFKPYDEIPITVTGLKVGEKLYDEFMPDIRFLKETEHNKIFVIDSISVDGKDLFRKMGLLWESLNKEGDAEARRALADLVTDYRIRS